MKTYIGTTGYRHVLLSNVPWYYTVVIIYKGRFGGRESVILDYINLGQLTNIELTICMHV